MRRDNPRRALPSVDYLLNLQPVGDLVARYGRSQVAESVRAALAVRRSALAKSGHAADAFDEAAFIEDCAAWLAARNRSAYPAVFNLTGTVLHTNLGRAVMPQSAADAVSRIMTRPAALEFDLAEGRRGERDAAIERLLVERTEAEAAAVVNNNAAAVYLTLNALAARKEVVVSRGELIEIGGSFRIPDIMASAGCKLREVGTTNRTHLRDFAAAITGRTAAIMKVHTSNYEVRGFTAMVPERELAALAREHEVPFIVDLGSGTLVDLERFGLPHEWTPREALASGADVVTFSGDKLLGGPQAGLIVGREQYVARIRKHPMKRALRVDKMTLAALEAVLMLYANPDRVGSELPALRSLSRSAFDIKAQAERLLPAVAAAVEGQGTARVIACGSQIGSGALPVDSLPSAGIAIAAAGKKSRGSFASGIAEALRSLPVPVIGRVSEGEFVMDFRCLEDEEEFLAQLRQLRLAPRP